MKEVNPPKWAERFLRWYCNPDFLEEIQGDIWELFDRRLEEGSPGFARRKFLWDVVRFFRWSNLKRSNSKYKMNRFVLFNNYLKLGFRNISKNLLISSINIFGLSLAIGVAITTYIFLDLQLNMDSFHLKKDRIYQVLNHVNDENGLSLWSDSPLLLGPSLEADISSVESTARVEFAYADIRYKDQVFSEFMAFVDPAFFQIFDFELRYGDKKALANKEQLVISSEIAKKYFGDSNPIGKEVSIKFNSTVSKRFVIGAVLEKYSHRASFGWGVYIPFENFVDLKLIDNYDWSYMTDATFVLMKEREAVSALSNKYEEYVAIQNGSNPEWDVKGFEPLDLNSLSENSYRILGSVSNGGHPAGRLALGVIAALLLAMACFNFMNISVASASRRLKEIALRKVMGGVRKQIINQFLVENILQCVMALVLGTITSYFFFVPGFNAMVQGIEIPFSFSEVQPTVIFFVSLLIVVGFSSGAYPAFYISKFQPISIIRGNQKFGSKNLFSKILLGIQFFMAFVTIVGCFVFTDQGIYLGQRGWGYEPNGIMAVPVENTSQFEKLRNGIQDHPKIQSIAGSFGHIADYDNRVNLDILGDQTRAVTYSVSGDYFETLNLKLKEGRWLTDRPQDQQSSVVVNERFVDAMDWDEPIGRTFTYDSVRRTVVGVVTNFHYASFYADILPVFFQGIGEGTTSYLSLKTSPENEIEVDAFVQSVWKDIAPDDPYLRTFQSDAFDDFYAENDSNVSLMLVISTFAIILACLGLYGLISFNIQMKLKEFSVRKVLGAKASTIVKVASRQYTWIISIAFILGAPLGYFLINMLVGQIFVEPKETSIYTFVIAIVAVFLTVTITVSGQVIRAIKVNPAEILRNE